MNRKKMKRKNRRTIPAWGYIALGAGIVFILVMIVWTMQKDSDHGAPADGEAVNVQQEKKGTGTETVDCGNLPGYQNGADSGQAVCGLTLPYTIPDTSLTIEGIGGYTGPFVEDGSDRPVVNVLAAVIKNDSDQDIEFAEIKFQAGDSGEAVFRMSVIPAGESALILEMNRRVFAPEEIFSFRDKLYAQMTDRTLGEQEIKVTAEGGKIFAENLTDQFLGDVYVRYKNMLTSDCYLGGITYSCKLENLGAGETAGAETEHFSPEGSKVLMVQTIEE